MEDREVTDFFLSLSFRKEDASEKKAKIDDEGKSSQFDKKSEGKKEDGEVEDGEVR